MNVCVLGTGYVGLVTAAGFADLGNHVIAVDVDQHKIEQLKRGEIPIFEPGLDTLVQRNHQAKRLRFTTEIAASIAQSDVVFITVGTPANFDGSADLSGVDRAADGILPHLRENAVVVMKSTVPVGTNRRLRERLAAHPTVHVLSNPEFLKEGAAVDDFARPDRIVIGIDPSDAYAKDVMQRLYHPLCLDRDRIVWMDPASAELTKQVANTMLAMRVSFMNEVAALCEKVGADIHSVRTGVGSDARIGPKFLYAGPGYGGSCFPKDVQALCFTAETHGVTLDLARVTHQVNLRQRGVLAEKLRQSLPTLKGARIALWGVAFKPKTDDIRESPALTLIETLLAEGATVVVHDPAAGEHAKLRFEGRVTVVDDAYDAPEGADALVLVTEWPEYRNPDFDRLRTALKRPVLIDGRNVWTADDARARGFTYQGIGQGGLTV